MDSIGGANIQKTFGELNDRTEDLLKYAAYADWGFMFGWSFDEKVICNTECVRWSVYISYT